MARSKIAILISGRGSNMQALVAACDDGRVPAEVALVVSNKPAAAGVAWAREHGLPVLVLSHRDHPDRASHDRAVVAALAAAEVEWVCLAGYMRLLSAAFIAAYEDRIVNVHPSLLPAFPGLDAQAQALAHGVRVSGCTVHLVDRELDHGAIVGQAPVTVAEGDTVDSLAARILDAEHRLYPECLARLLTRPWRRVGRCLVWSSAKS